MPPRPEQLAALLEDHSAAVEEFFHRAAQVTSARWNAARADGKWSPAQEVKHVILAYEAFIAELEGGAGLKLVGTPLKRALWRLLGLGSVLLRKRLPRGARSPREIRPPEGPYDQVELLADLRERAARFEATYRAIVASNPEKRMTHPYFGALDLVDALKLVAVHTRHHAAVLPPPGARQQVGA